MVAPLPYLVRLTKPAGSGAWVASVPTHPQLPVRPICPSVPPTAPCLPTFVCVIQLGILLPALHGVLYTLRIPGMPHTQHPARMPTYTATLPYLVPCRSPLPSSWDTCLLPPVGLFSLLPFVSTSQDCLLQTRVYAGAFLAPPYRCRPVVPLTNTRYLRTTWQRWRVYVHTLPCLPAVDRLPPSDAAAGVRLLSTALPDVLSRAPPPTPTDAADTGRGAWFEQAGEPTLTWLKHYRHSARRYDAGSDELDLPFCTRFAQHARIPPGSVVAAALLARPHPHNTTLQRTVLYAAPGSYLPARS